MTLTQASRVAINVPEQAFASDVPLVAVMRGEYVGSLHRGTFAVSDGDGKLRLSAGDPSQYVFMRSAAKPFQVMPAILAGAVERFGLTPDETAVLCASHNAEPVHRAAVLSVLKKAGLSEDALRCGAHPPLHEGSAMDLVRQGDRPTAVCNNCSGAHAGMLLACVARDWPIEGYGDLTHPLQQQTLQILADFAGLKPEPIRLATDNCAVPAFALPISNAALAFARLVTGSGVSAELEQAAATVCKAMTTSPYMVAGEGRFDTDLMMAGDGDIVAKGGAEAFQGIGVRPLGLGFALKISDGAQRASHPVSVEVLNALGALSAVQLSALKEYSHPEVRNPSGDLVGNIEPSFSVGSME